MPHSHGAAPVVPHELDLVEFTAPVEGWPIGTRGTLVEPFDADGFVELADGELVVAPYHSLRVVWSSD